MCVCVYARCMYTMYVCIKRTYVYTYVCIYVCMYIYNIYIYMQQFAVTADVVRVQREIPTSKQRNEALSLLQPSGQSSRVEGLVCAPDQALHKKVRRCVCR